MNINDFNINRATPIKMITCYDYWTAKIIAHTDIDCVLVGDSLAQIMHGADSTTYCDVDMIVMHTKAVKNGIGNKFIIGDMPFMSYRKSLKDSVNNVEKIIKAGANAIKLEGVEGNENLIRHIVDSGVPVMGHIGFTPQSINIFGNNIVQGKKQTGAVKLKSEAKKLEEAGCFAIVLECIPEKLAKEIADSLSIPTIGIGAGKYTKGQVLVLQDLLGADPNFNPKFLKKYVNIYEIIKNSVNQYCYEVDSQIFPNELNSYKESKNDSN